MLEQIATFLLSLAVAAAGLVGLDTASTAPHGAGSEEVADARAELAREEAAARFAAALEAALAAMQNAETADENGEIADTHGAGTATTAINNSPAWEAAGGASDDGLTTALAAIDSGGSGGDDAGEDEDERPENVPPVAPPTAPPTDVPAGPSDAPGGRP